MCRAVAILLLSFAAGCTTMRDRLAGARDIREVAQAAADFYVSDGDDGEYVTVRSGGEYSLVLLRNLYPKITGVSVACRGGNDAEVRKKLIDVISTALGIPSNRICIVGTK